MNANEISQGINRLKNRIDEALNRSVSATLNSHRGLSATLDAAPQQVETNKSASYTTTESDLYRSVQNYQVKSVHGFEPSYLPVHNHYQSFLPTQSYIQPLIIPYGHHYAVQEVRSATYGYEQYPWGAPTHSYQPANYVDDYEGRLSQRNESSGKKKSVRGRKQDIQNDEDSFSKDSNKNQPQAQQNQVNNVAQQNQQQSQPAQQNQQQSQPARQNQQQNQPNNAAQQNQQQSQPAQQNQQQSQPNNAAQQNQQQNQSAQQNQQDGMVQQNQKSGIDKSSLVQLPKKPYLIDTYNFGQEKRRGGSQRI